MSKQTSPGTGTTTNNKRKRTSEAPAPLTDSKAAASAQPATSSAPAAASNKRAPTHEEIAQRAFALYEARGGHGGDPLNDWLAAERELCS